MFIIRLLSKLFCRHTYRKVGWKEEEENNVRYSLRLYRCIECGKYIWVDGRRDPYEVH